MNDYLRSLWPSEGDNVVGFVQFFSLPRYFDNFRETAKSLAVGASPKVALSAAPMLAGNVIMNNTSNITTFRNAYYLNVGGKVLGKGLAVVAAVATLGATGADAIAYWECHDVKSKPKVENACDYH